MWEEWCLKQEKKRKTAREITSKLLKKTVREGTPAPYKEVAWERTQEPWKRTSTNPPTHPPQHFTNQLQIHRSHRTSCLHGRPHHHHHHPSPRLPSRQKLNSQGEDPRTWEAPIKRWRALKKRKEKKWKRKKEQKKKQVKHRRSFWWTKHKEQVSKRQGTFLKCDRM